MPATPVRVVVVTLDTHLASAAEQALRHLRTELPGLDLSLHAATEWGRDPEALQRCKEDIAQGDIVIATMLFMEDHIQAVIEDLRARRENCDAMMCAMSAGEVIRLTRMGQFDMSKPATGPMKLLKRLRGGRKSGTSAGKQQVAMLRRIPKILRWIPGTAQDVRAYFLTLQYMLAGSQDNVANMVRYLVDRYAAGARAGLRGRLDPAAPADYPETGLYHPRMSPRVGSDPAKLPRLQASKGRVGVLVMRSYVLAGNGGHYDGVISALEAKGYEVVPAFASGLDFRPAVEEYFLDRDGNAAIDALVSLTGFSLVGGPAYNDSAAAEKILSQLDVPYLAAHPVEFQTMEQWDGSELGLMPVEATMMVAIPELDGATGSMLFGGRSTEAPAGQLRDMHSHPERANMLARRIDRLVTLRKTPRGERKLAITLFNFPPNAGNTGTAAYLSVFESLHHTLSELEAAGYEVEVPDSVEALRDSIIHGNADQFGALANVAARIPVDDHVKRETWLKEIEAAWGPAPGRAQSDGRTIHVLGKQFGNVFVGVQPGFGYEGDPMRLLFEKGFAPTHAFSAFYRYLKEDFGANAVLHFGTHGALEFMPGKQTGLSGKCWPDRLIGDLPNYYLYAANNPSEGMLAKRRSAATLISYMTPPLARAGLYRELLELKGSIDRYRQLPPDRESERAQLASLIQTQATELDLVEQAPYWNGHSETNIAQVAHDVAELEQTLIPYGLHTVGQVPTAAQRAEMLAAITEMEEAGPLPQATLDALADGRTAAEAARAGGLDKDEATLTRLDKLRAIAANLSTDHETGAILHALDGRFVRPVPGGDLLRTPEVLPTGRNLHGFDPFRLPSTFAQSDGRRQADELLARYRRDGHALPESIAIVLWGTDNLKTEGAPIGQALALLGAKPRFDSFNRLAGAELLPLEELGRPRIDVVMTLSGIFRDLLPMQTKLLAEAAYLAAEADEPVEQNYVRKHTLAYMESEGCDFETAALRVFSNAEGAYGSNVNQLVENGRWGEEDELAEAYTKRKCFAYGRSGAPVKQSDLLNRMLGNVELAYQNLESAELGVTTIDQYFDTLGGISRAVGRAKAAQGKSADDGAGAPVAVYIGDQTKGDSKVRTLGEQVALETRTRSLNPKWYDGMLQHGYEGVRQIEAQITNTMGWSATTGQVSPWVYGKLTETFVLDDAMRERMAELNPAASARLANRLLEAHERQYWTADDAVLERLREVGEELEDRVEGVGSSVAA